MYSHAQILAFLYAGALTPDQKTDKFDDHGGHVGFVAKFEPLARQIADHLNLPQFAEVEHPGVVEYEIIEPLGKWILDHPMRQSTDAFDCFVMSYGTWLTSELTKNQRFEVQTLIGKDTWENVWTEDDKPLTFASSAEAQTALNDHINQCNSANIKISKSDFRIAM